MQSCILILLRGKLACKDGIYPASLQIPFANMETAVFGVKTDFLRKKSVLSLPKDLTVPAKVLFNHELTRIFARYEIPATGDELGVIGPDLAEDLG